MLSSFDDDRCMQRPNFCESISLGTKKLFTLYTLHIVIELQYICFFYSFFIWELQYVNESYDAAVLTIYHIISYKNYYITSIVISNFASENNKVGSPCYYFGEIPRQWKFGGSVVKVRMCGSREYPFVQVCCFYFYFIFPVFENLLVQFIFRLSGLI